MLKMRPKRAAYKIKPQGYALMPKFQIGQTSIDSIILVKLNILLKNDQWISFIDGFRDITHNPIYTIMMQPDLN
jgi:hypothetical protein